MAWTTTAASNAYCTFPKFEEAISIWLRRPNVCSKFISCSQVTELENPPKDDKIRTLLLTIGKNTTDVDNGEFSRKLYFRTLVPKKPNVHSSCCEFVIIGVSEAFFVPISAGFEPDFHRVWYKFHLEIDMENGSENKVGHLHDNQTYSTLKLEVSRSEFCCDQNDSCGEILKPCSPTAQWLKEKLFSSVLRWIKVNDEDSCSSTSRKFKNSLPHSLSLIPQHSYSKKYHYLKEKYGKELIKIWTEVTDPEKYIYEDIAIATYLILLWEKEREVLKTKHFQSFIDLGCGNGLLVHILNSEGHPGKGVDIRRRKIWDIYPPSTHLVEGVVDPTDGVLYTEFDWLLGNHSDELTPWIPVLAARSGYNVRYWVLPCCFFDFYTKYKRSQSMMGQYDDYLSFVRSVGDVCGFNVGIDVMRIPSTKRVCHVGMTKSYSVENHPKILDDIEKFISDRRITQSSFQAREKTEKVKNCTQMDKDIQNFIVKLIVDKLLEEKVIIAISPKELNSEMHFSQPKLDETIAFESAASTAALLRVGKNGSVLEDSSNINNSLETSNKGKTESNVSAFSTSADRDGVRPLSTVTTQPACDDLTSEHLALQSDFALRMEGHVLQSFEEKVSCEGVVCGATYDPISRITWNRGGCLTLEEASKLLSADLRLRMKNECGGLQTLLRNHHQVFEVSNGKVRIRDWSNLDTRLKRRRRKNSRLGQVSKESKKTRPCWFFANHPDGCPRTVDQCSFLHK